MAKLLQTRGAQYVKQAEYVFNFDDTAVNTSGATVDFGKVNTSATSVDIIDLPVDATVVGGSVTTETAFDAATYNITVGDSATANRYLGTTDRKGTGTTALVPTGFRTDGSPLRLTFTAADTCTGGKMTVRVQYVVGGQVNENSF